MRVISFAARIFVTTAVFASLQVKAEPVLSTQSSPDATEVARTAATISNVWNLSLHGTYYKIVTLNAKPNSETTIIFVNGEADEPGAGHSFILTPSEKYLIMESAQIIKRNGHRVVQVTLRGQDGKNVSKDLVFNNAKGTLEIE